MNRTMAGLRARVLRDGPPGACAWFDGKTFTTDWASSRFRDWTRWLAPLRRRRVSVLEVGSWEGLSALFFLNFLPRARLCCVDAFMPAAERRFDRNLAAHRRRLRKLKSRSFEGLARLGLEGRRFDVAYIDASHRPADVYADAVLAWPLLRAGGLLIFDDLPRTRRGVEAFLAVARGGCDLLHRGYQLALVKRPAQQSATTGARPRVSRKRASVPSAR